MIDIQKIVDFYLSPVIFGIILELLMILSLAWLLRKKPDSHISIIFETIYTKMHDFYIDILGQKESRWILTYIMTLFFVIFFSNFLGVLLELIAPFFGINSEGEFYLEHYISVPSADINFNLSMALMSMAVLIYIQIKATGIGGFLYQFVPFRGKGYIPLKKGNMSDMLYYPLLIVTKTFDITISIFLGLLDLTEYFARTISLSFRLFGNMVSGGILMGMVFIGLGATTSLLGDMIGKGFENIFSLIGFPGVGVYVSSALAHNFPVIIPIFLYLEEILVSFIQAMVFALLVSIFIKVALAELENEEELIGKKEQGKLET